MQAELAILVEQISIFATLIVFGFFAQKIKLINDSQIDALSGIVVRLLLPCMIITSVTGGGTISEMLQMLPFMLCSYAMIFILLSIGWVSGKLLKIPQPTRNIHTAVIGFPNSGFIGYPLFLAMFPKEAPLVIAVYLIVDATTIWTIGPILADEKASIKDFNYKKLINPATISLFISLCLVALNVRPDNVAWQTMKTVGGMTKYFALIYIGADIGRKSFKKLFAKPVVFTTIPIKLIFAPLLIFFIFHSLNILSDQLLSMLTIMSMLPSMVIISMLAKAGNSDEEYASAGLIVTTLSSMVTMPFVMWIVTKLL